MDSLEMTPEELVQTLRRSSLPTILVEGRDDMTVYRWMEFCDSSDMMNIMPCFGRKSLLEVFERRNEFNQISCAFVADRDMWLFTKAPDEYDEVIFTKGYSIENDLLDGSTTVISLFTQEERSEFDVLCDALAKWFAFEVEQYRRGECYFVDIHPNRLIPLRSTELNMRALSHRSFREPNKSLIRSIRNNFHLKFRGKSLINLYTRFLSTRRRKSKYSYNNILEMSTKCDNNNHMKRLIRLIKRKIPIS